MQKSIDILLLTCNRWELSKKTITGIVNRMNFPFNLIVIDNASNDETPAILKNFEEEGWIKKLILLNEDQKTNIAGAYNLGLQWVETEYFLTMQDDCVIPDLEPSVAVQLMKLMEKYPDHGGIGCRIQHIPNMSWTDGDISPVRKALSAYCRIQRLSDLKSLKTGFGSRDWDDLAFRSQMEKIGKKCAWANDLWVDHIGHRPNRGYPKGYKRMWGWDKNRIFNPDSKPYPKIDPKTNKPLPGEKIYK